MSRMLQRLRLRRRPAVIAFLCVALHAASAAVASAAVDYNAIMRATVDRWVRAQSENGLFYYGFDFLNDRAIEHERLTRPQLVRQAFTAYVLAKYYAHFRDPRLQEPLRRALSAYGSLSLPIGKRRAQEFVERAGVMSLPVGRWRLQTALAELGWLYTRAGEGRVPSPNGTYEAAVTSAAAIALLAELTYSRASGDQSFAALRTGWLNALLLLHVSGGGFRQSPAYIDDDDHYLNAHAWIALATYVDRVRTDEPVNRALTEVEDRLMRVYSKQPQIDFYHWGAMAAAQRFETTGDVRFLDFLRQQAEYFFERIEPKLESSGNACAHMEGVAATVAALERAKSADPLKQRMITWLAARRDAIPGLQIQNRQQSLALGGTAYLVAPRMPEFAGEFVWGASEPMARIDAGAHCVSALLMLQDARLMPVD